MKTIKVGTRSSLLAKIQTSQVVAQLKNRFPYIEFETVYLSSVGDETPEKPLCEIGGSGLFTSRLETELIGGSIDFAVHSLKDLPAVQPHGLGLAKSPLREDPRDALVLPEGFCSLPDLPAGARVGTGSPRRSLQLSALRQDLIITPLRGNVDTRLKKVGAELDAVVLAAAGLIRAGFGDRISYYFSPEEMVPAPGQGILALETVSDNTEILEILSAISDAETETAASAERGFLRETAVGCHAPVGAYCRCEGSEILLSGLYGADGAVNFVRGSISGARTDAADLGKRLADRLLREYEEKYL